MEHVQHKGSQEDLKPVFDIIMFPSSRWDGPYSSSAFSISKAFAAHTRVFYIDTPFTLKDLIGRFKAQQIRKRLGAFLLRRKIYSRPDEKLANLIAVTPGLILPVNWLPPGRLYNLFSWINDRIISAALNRTIREHGMKPFIFINSFNPIYGRYFNWTKTPLLTIYYNVDDISQSSYLKNHGPVREAELIRKADFTLVTSTELKRRSERYSPKVHLIPNAADTALFESVFHHQYPMPDDLRKVAAGRKIICYVGNICKRIDYDLLIKLAAHHHDKLLLMIGPFANDLYKTTGLVDLPNVYFAGKKKLQELPAYLSYSNVCIIPFLKNQLTRSIYPLKINEYLAAGKPVITTDFSEDISAFHLVAYVADSTASFIRFVDHALLEDSPSEALRRLQFVKENNWENRAADVLNLCAQELQIKNKDLDKIATDETVSGMV